MEFNKTDLYMGLEIIAQRKLKRELENQGFKVELNKRIGHHEVDLYAESSTEKRVYEFKIAGNHYKPDQFDRYKEIAASISAKFLLIFVKTPTFKNIQYEGLEEKMTKWLINDFPPELIDLSQHTRFSEVLLNDIDEAIISDESVRLAGSACIGVTLQYGSDGDMRRDNGSEEYASFDFTFSIELEDGSITNFEYDINTNSFYGKDDDE